MMSTLEELAAQLMTRPPEGPLTGLETRVWARIAARQRAPSSAAIWGWRSAAAALLVALGVIAGGAAAAHASSELALFSPHPALAPSTLLGENR
jgi:hypothetical protein